MKRNNKVVSKKAVKIGRRMARWGASGMNWHDTGEGFVPALKAESRAILGGGAVACAALGEKFLRGDQHKVYWQTPATGIILGWTEESEA